MNKSKLTNRFSLVSILLMIMSAFCFCMGAVQLTNGSLERANAQVNIDISEEIAQEYAFGDQFVLPECTFTRGGESVKGVASLQFPDGTEVNKGETTLNQSGKYVLRYIASIENKVYTKEYKFTVYGKLAEYSNSKTSMSYGLCTDFGASSEGLMVEIANGDSLTFNHVFDMNETTMAKKLLEGFVVPTVQGSVDFARMVFTFTDVEDPTVQLVYYGNFYDDSNAHGLTYFTAAGNGQIHCGLEHVGRLHVGTSLGCMVPHSFMAVDTGLYWGAKKAEPTAPDAKKFCISYDGKTNQAWAGGKIISDLDDSNYYDTLWFGFPSGKAKLTVSALNYNNATAKICFTSIMGVDLSAENYIDEEAPEITTENEYDTMPNAVVGGTYPIPAASAIDKVSGKSDVKVSVWYNYGTDNQKMINVVNGEFAVKNVGVYAIVYEATDYSGNVGRKVLWVRAHLSQYVEELTVTIDSAYDTEIEVGSIQKLPEVTILGGSGDCNVIYSITKGQKVCEIIDGTFCLEEAGEWTLTCTAVDYAGNAAIAVCTLNGVIGDKPIVTDIPKFPHAYISDSAYALPDLYAYDYSSGDKVGKLCDVSVEYNGKTVEYKAGEMFIPTVDNHNDSIKIVYSCEGEKIFEKEIPVVVVFTKERIPGNTERYRDVVNADRYFYTQDAVSLTNNYTLTDINGLLISATQATNSAKVSFITPQAANAFSLDFLSVPSASAFSQMKVTLIDGENSNIAITASLIKNEGQTLMVVGDTQLILTLDFDGAAAARYSIGFANGQFIVNNTTSVAVSKTNNGEAFHGFTSGKVYFEIEMCDAKAGASVFLSKICGINVSNNQDSTGPHIATENNVEMNAFKDSIYTVQKVVATDVLCPNTVAFLTVIGPDGEVVKSVDGVLLSEADATIDYQIELSQYGEYYVSVIAKEADSWKYSNQSYFEYAVTVVDGEAPTITFKEEFKTSLQVGDMLVIPTYTVSDNYTEADKITVLTMVLNPKGMPVYLYEDTNAVRCEYAGEYKVIIYVYDQMGNLTTFEKSVTVK